MRTGEEGVILVTGAAGFIGYHLSERLLREGRRVVGVDNVNPYYDVRLKEARLRQLATRPGFSLERLNLAERDKSAALFAHLQPKTVVHLAAQAGVRYSLNHPHAYVDSNLVAFINVLEGCRQNDTEHFLFASSSSVYGLNGQLPFSVKHNVDHPANLYAATKKANELFAHSYSSLYGLPVTGLRFFTVYGPWGRPDMVLFLFTEAILEGRPIQIFNYGRMKRDFTYVDDVVEALWRLIDRPPAPNPDWAALGSPPDTSPGPYCLYNIGGSNPVDLMEMVRTLEAALGREADKVMLPMQAGDVAATWADVTQLNQAIGYVPATPLSAGIERFVRWYIDEWRPLVG